MSTKDTQRALNAFTNRYLKYVAPLLVDGEMGHATRKRIRLCKFYLGYVKSRRDAKVGHEFLNRLRHPKNPRYADPIAIARGMRRRSQQRRAAKRNHARARKTNGVGHFDGIPVANVAIPILQWCRAHGWRGRLVSGWRDPNYSRSLCLHLCGAPSCPGRCAGLSSNHVGSTPARFAVDVSDYVNFGRVVAKCPIEPRIFNALGAQDPVHFSPSGR